LGPHVYDGANGTEIGLLLRRLRERVVASERGRLRAIATSATLGGGPADYPTLAAFGRDLFDETFEYDPADPKRQDIVGPERLPLARATVGHELPVRAYREIRAAYEAAPAARRPAAIAAAAAPHAPDAAAAARVAPDAGQALLAVLTGDARVIALQAMLEEGAADIRTIVPRVMGTDGTADDLAALVDLSVRARRDENDASLVPARYHFWLRGLEGAFACLHPRHPEDRDPLYLRVFEACPACEAEGRASVTAELGACRSCRSEYLIGTGSEPLRRAPVGVTPTAFVLLDPPAGDEDEDEDPLPAGLPTSPVFYCPGCGFLLADRDSECGCDSPPPRVPGTRVFPVEGEPLRRCAACSGSSASGEIVGRFLTDANAPAAVVATALYQELPPASEPALAAKLGGGRKLLAFADSRQDAAFFAPFLERTYGTALTRSLILRALREIYRGDPLRPDDLVPWLLAESSRALVLDPGDSPASRTRTVRTWIIRELMAIDRRQTLDGTGLVRVTPALPADVPAALGPLGLSDAESHAVCAVLLDTLRASAVLAIPPDVSREDPAFAPRNRDYTMRGSGGEARRSVLGWVPTTGSNRRHDYLRRLLAARGTAGVDLSALLLALWDEMTIAGSPWERLLPAGLDAARGQFRRLAADRLDLVPAPAAGQAFRCTNCRSVAWYSVALVCPTYHCAGRLVPIAPDEPLGHYATLYETLKPIVLRASEHTAQWALEKGTQVQTAFIGGDINVLSCSTTFELGVDVGEVESVLLRNVPPSPANYVQRAGRAGRRAGSAALVVTLAQRRNHDIAFFRDPRAMVEGAVAPPRLVTNNPIIARRHAHSVALALFLRVEGITSAGAFFEERDAAGHTADARFIAWLETRPPALHGALARLLPPAAAVAIGVETWAWVRALVSPSEEDPSAGWLARAGDEVRTEIAALAALEAEASGARQYSRAGALARQVTTIRSYPLINFLARRNVLPKYGFPVDVVELDLSRSGIQDAAGIELDRDLRMAIAEYSPGSELVAGGRVWRSIGLRRFAGRDWPEHGYAVCRDCNGYRETVAADAPDACPTCGSEQRSLRGRRIRPIFGFVGAASDSTIGETPIRRRATIRSWFTDYGPGDPPVSREPEGVAPGSVRTLVSRSGRIVVLNLGPGTRGFRICGSCGWGAPVPTDKATKKAARATHPNIRTGGECRGTVGTYSLSHDFLSDVLEIRLAGLHTEAVLRSALYALLEGASAVGIARDEIDGTLHTFALGASQSMIIFDTVPGGAGHAGRIEGAFADVVAAAIERVAGCDCGIETSCYGCLRSYTNQLHHEDLRRDAALAVLTPLLGARR
jgi:hypothetical protein